MMMIFKGMIADHPTPKISEGRVAFTLNSRDYKGVMLAIYEASNSPGTPPQRLTAENRSDRNMSDLEQPNGDRGGQCSTNNDKR